MNIRVVDVGISIIGRDGRETNGIVVLNNPGGSLVKRESTYVREIFPEAEAGVHHLASVPFDLETLAQRWSGAVTPSRNAFEGYGLYGTWILKFPWSAELSDLKDVHLRFAYFYQSNTNARHKPGTLEDVSSKPVDLVLKGGVLSRAMTIPVIPTFGNAATFSKCVVFWQSESRPKSCSSLSPDMRSCCMLPDEWGLGAMLRDLADSAGNPARFERAVKNTSSEAAASESLLESIQNRMNTAIVR